MALRKRKERFCKTKFVQLVLNFIERLNRSNAIAGNVKGKAEFYGKDNLIWQDWGKINCRKITNDVIRYRVHRLYKGSQNIIVSRYTFKCNFIYDTPLIKMRPFLSRFSRNWWTLSSNTCRSLIPSCIQISRKCTSINSFMPPNKTAVTSPILTKLNITQYIFMDTPHPEFH